jgi:hypothetical protein
MEEFDRKVQYTLAITNSSGSKGMVRYSEGFENRGERTHAFMTRDIFFGKSVILV